jgi:predicted NAD-dependent protein-ADP-ribosyltransferase YbiA (DUF1768 family)
MAETEQQSGAAVPQPPPLEVPPLSELTPYSKETKTQIERFYKKRAKLPELYGYTTTGNLDIKDTAATGTVNLLRFTPLEPAYRDAQEQTRLDGIAELEGEIATAKGALRDAWTTGAVGAILRANQDVTGLEARRAALRSAVRALISMENPITRDILLDQPYETRKLIPASTDPFDKEVVKMVYRDFPPTRFYGRYIPDEEAKALPKPQDAPDETEFRKALKDGRQARIVFDTENPVNGFLSPMWPVEFTFKETRYFTALQAYEAERARELGQTELRETILKTRSARTIRILTKSSTENPVDAKGLWLAIYTAVYQQHPELQTKLLQTGTDAIVFADMRSGPSGTFLSEKDRNILDPAMWKGENAVGLAQETVRTRLREATLAEAPAEEAKEGVVSEQEQAAAKVGAIINARRSRPQ